MTGDLTPKAAYDLRIGVYPPKSTKGNVTKTPSPPEVAAWISRAQFLIETTNDMFPIIKDIAQSIVSLDGRTIRNTEEDQSLQRNVLAQVALEKLEGKLRFSFDTVNTPATVRTSHDGQTYGLAATVVNNMITTYYGGTIWDGLLRLTGELNCMIVPGIDRSIMVPWAPAIKSAASDITLEAEDLVYAAQSTRVSGRALKAVLIAIPSVHATNDNVAKKLIPQGGIFVSDVRESGMITTASAPSWMSFVDIPKKSVGAYDVGLGVVSRCGKNARKRLAQRAGRDIAEPDQALSKRADQLAQQIADLWAHSRYINLAYGSNSVSAAGPYRTDVTPGMVVGVFVPADNNTDGFDDQSKKLYAHIQSVTISIDANKHAIQNSYVLTHLRDEIEDPDLATGHPFYDGRILLRDIQGNAVEGSASGIKKPSGSQLGTGGGPTLGGGSTRLEGR
jgi:hypothetical protein